MTEITPTIEPVLEKKARGRPRKIKVLPEVVVAVPKEPKKRKPYKSRSDKNEQFYNTDGKLNYKKYYEAHKLELVTKAKAKTLCPCGSLVRHDGLPKHLLTDRHIKNLEYIILRNKI